MDAAAWNEVLLIFDTSGVLSNKAEKIQEEKPKQTKKPSRNPWITQSHERDENGGRIRWLIGSI